jgi:hypothetical protein
MENIENYLNTMIFIILAKGITIALLILLLLEMGQQMSYVIITVQFGLLAVAAWAIYMIVVFDRQTEKLKKTMATSPAVLETCPDYYVRTYDESDNIICTNVFTTADDRYTYTMFSGASNLNMSALLNETKTMEALCNKSSIYAEYPWTEYKAKCNKL